MQRSWNLRPKCVETLCALTLTAGNSRSSCKQTLWAAAKKCTALSCHINININMTATNPCNAGFNRCVCCLHCRLFKASCNQLDITGSAAWYWQWQQALLVLYSGHQVIWQPLFCLPKFRQLITNTAFRSSPRLIRFKPYLSATPSTELANLIRRCYERKPISRAQIITKPISCAQIITKPISCPQIITKPISCSQIITKSIIL